MTTQEVATLLDLPVHRIRSYARAGFISPVRGPHNEYDFSFQDLVLLRTAAELERENVPARHIMEALAQVRASLPSGRPLSEVRLRTSGQDVVVSEPGEPLWNPRSGQLQIDFEGINAAGSPIAPLARDVSERVHQPAPSESAVELFERAVEAEVESSEEARDLYSRALHADPALHDARVNLGRLLHEAGRLSEAEAQYRHVLSVVEHPLAAYNLGVVLEDQGQITESIQAYARAIAANPSLAEAHYNLARLYEQRGDRRAAIRHFNGYRELVKRP
jgi:tetratricopeptide (TPR) repeat protein